MKKTALLIGYIAVLVIAVLASAHFLNTKQNNCLRHCLEQKMELSSTQKNSIAKIETAYKANREVLEHQLNTANRRLGELLVLDGYCSVRVQAELNDLHKTMAELQLLTLQYVFSMKDVLTAEQYQELLEFTAKSLATVDTHDKK